MFSLIIVILYPTSFQSWPLGILSEIRTRQKRRQGPSSRLRAGKNSVGWVSNFLELSRRIIDTPKRNEEGEEKKMNVRK